MLILTYIKRAVVAKAVSVTVFSAVIRTDALLKDRGSAGTDTTGIAIVIVAVKSDNGDASAIVTTAVAAPEFIIFGSRSRFVLTRGTNTARVGGSTTVITGFRRYRTIRIAFTGITSCSAFRR